MKSPWDINHTEHPDEAAFHLSLNYAVADEWAELRDQRIGTKLMRRAEAEALDRGRHHAHLTMLDFQARSFYDRLGYTVFDVLDDYSRPHERFLMQKHLIPLIPILPIS